MGADLDVPRQHPRRLSVCTYETYGVDVTGSAKGATGWFSATQASVYVDHPFHSSAEHALIIDVLGPAAGPSARAAFELDAPSARRLATAILTALDSVPPGVIDDPERHAS
jgi:Family of unknown function (DUF6295)